jgi:spore coat polysaccharide biosynthesis protein SpsF (cytidylyltransferase family)
MLNFNQETDSEIGVPFVVAIQVRTNATRLPGKMLLPFVDDKTIPHLIIKTALRCFDARDIVVATTKSPQDDELVQSLENYPVGVFRGDEYDVLSRFLEICKQRNVQHVIRICGDNPFLSETYLREIANKICSDPSLDYVSYELADGTPTILSHKGFYAEAVSLRALREAETSGNLQHKEHATLYMLEHMETFNKMLIPVAKEVSETTELRLTVDTAEDFAIAQQVYMALYAQYGCQFTVDQVLQTVKTLKLLDVMGASIARNGKASLQGK